MAVFRVERTNNYTVMSNYHLRDKSLSLKAKGLLSLMLSLPETWDYTLSGLARISLEGKDAIRAAVVELEKAGYIQRSRTRNEKGHLQGTEYIIREQPVFSAQPALEEPASENPTLEDTTQLKKENNQKKNLNPTKLSAARSFYGMLLNPRKRLKTQGFKQVSNSFPLIRSHPLLRASRELAREKSREDIGF